VFEQKVSRSFGNAGRKRLGRSQAGLAQRRQAVGLGGERVRIRRVVGLEEVAMALGRHPVGIVDAAAADRLGVGDPELSPK
jgi:hypothetical protein